MEIIEHKSETFFIFKRYQVRNQKDDFKIHRFRIDYDEKYEDYDFDCHRADQDIFWKFIIFENLEQNGVVERFN